MKTLVIGAGGLLGSALRRVLAAQGCEVTTLQVPWPQADTSDPAPAIAVLERAFADLVASDHQWRVAWCAGAGVVSTPPQALDGEVELFRAVLNSWRPLVQGEGAIFLASSAGGVYAGSGRAPFTERTVERPVVPYGHAKLAMEQHLRDFSRDTGVPALIGRISNLYGPGQDLAKGQGLISAICRAAVTGVPLPVYVPLDTCRDYLYVDDCARMVARALRDLPTFVSSHPEGSGWVVRILSATHGSGHTIQDLLEVAEQVFGSPPPYRTDGESSGRGQVADLRFDSAVWPELDEEVVTPLAAGMAATMTDVRRRLRGHEG